MTITKARKLRRTMTPPELTLWDVLRQRPGGYQFRRQHSRAPFIFDFFCRAAGLAIEVDGMAHEMGDNPARDARRDSWAAKKGIETLRFSTRDVQRNLEGVVQMILLRCDERTPPPPSAVPLPGKGRGGI